MPKHSNAPHNLFDPTDLDVEDFREDDEMDYEDGLVIRTIDDLLEEALV